MNLTSLRLQTDESLKQEKLIAQLVRLLRIFGLAAVMRRTVRNHGHSVVRRTNEIGIRMALGAERRKHYLMVLKRACCWSRWACHRVPAAWAAAHLISSQLFGLNPSDPVTLLTAAVLLTMVAALAGYLPARKASRVNRWCASV